MEHNRLSILVKATGSKKAADFVLYTTAFCMVVLTLAIAYYWLYT
jgi:hypothetical protein